MEHITKGRILVVCSNCKIKYVKWRMELHKENFHDRACYFNFIRKGKHKFIGQPGNKHPNWQGGRNYINNEGYRVVWCPNHHRSHQNVVLEHILVMEEKIGRLLKSKEEIHHINHERLDNRPENLELCKNHSQHLRRFSHK